MTAHPSPFASHIAMKQSPNHRDDRNIPHNPTLRTKLEAALWVAQGMANQRGFGGKYFERRANRGELLMLEYAEQLLILDAIDFEFIRPVEIIINPDSEIG